MAKFCNILSSVLLGILAILALLLFVPMLFGYTELAVLSGSMEPNIPLGSIVYVDKDIKGEDLEINDVVSYALPSGTYVTHRVISLDNEKHVMVTQGDANNSPDGEIEYSRILGRVKFHIPYLGYISANIRTSKGIIAVTVVIAVVILLNFLPAILKAPDDKKKPSKK